MADRVDYDEFGLFGENAEEYGLPFDHPPTVRRVFTEVAGGRRLSALVWQERDPELVLLHGGSQNAHTWDTVAMALDRPLVAIDLPGHGHSDGPAAPREGQLDIQANAADVATVVRQLAPAAQAVVGMSFGGLTTIALAAQAPELVRKVVLVDVLPGVKPERARTSPTSSAARPASPAWTSCWSGRPSSTRPGPGRRCAGASCTTRSSSPTAPGYGGGPGTAGPARTIRPRRRPATSSCGRTLSSVTVPVLLARGMRPDSVVDDDNERELLRRLPSAQVVHVEGAGHSLQGDTPLELAGIIERFVFGS